MSTIQSSAEHLTLNADGSSKDIKLQSNASEKVIVKSDGKVGIGTSSPAQKLTIEDTTASNTSTYVSVVSGTGGNAGITFGDSDADLVGGVLYNNTDNALRFFKSGFTEAMRINSSGAVGIGRDPAALLHLQSSEPEIRFTYTGNSGYSHIKGSANNELIFSSGTTDGQERMRVDSNGDVLIGTTTSGGRLEVTDVDNASAPVVGINANSYSSGSVYHIRFRVNDSTKGSVTSNGSSIAYNTSSDHRLKENVDYNWDATARLKQLKPCRFNWIADDTNTLIDGFIAHEVSSIVPEAVSGEKDAMTSEVLYAEGDEIPEGKSVGDVKTASEPDYQGIDQSKLVPLLVKTIQELEARITALEA